MFTDVVDELIGFSDAELLARMEANELERRRLDAEMSAALAVGKNRNLHGADGHRSMTAFCRATFNWSTAEAGRRLALARAVDALPGLGDAWTNGHVGGPQALKLAGANANPRISAQLPRFVPDLLVHAEQMPYTDFATVVDHFVTHADTDGAHDRRDDAIEHRSARVVDVGGSLDLHASGGDGLVCAELIAIHERFTELEFRQDLDARRAGSSCSTETGDESALARTDRQRRFDALVAIFRSAAAANRVDTPAEPLVNILIDARTWGRTLLEAGLGTATTIDGRRVDPFTALPADDTDHLIDDLTGAVPLTCQTTNGVTLHPHDALRAALAGHVRRTVMDSGRVVIDLGRRQRLFTGAARRAARLLIRRCEHTGCELPADWCDIDHNVEWQRDSGTTDQCNAAILCRTHNNHKHRHRWRTQRASNGTSYTIRPDGTLILPVGARPPQLGDGTDDGDTFDILDDDDLADDDFHDDPVHVARQTARARSRVQQLVHSP